jgi:phage shock protein PspC (stress-responsive transcriptional regulator)
MNDRIKELLARPELERLNDWVNVGPIQKATLEVFAGLIIKECLDGVVDGIADKFGIEP